ncbi:MAG: hypothetical protein ABW321_01630 [Polyangiales bacterium]
MIAALLAHTESASAADPTVTGGIGSVTSVYAGISLTLQSETEWLTAETAIHVRDTFFNTYPDECALFNPNCPRAVTIVIKPSLIPCPNDKTMAPGCAGGTSIAVAGDWLWYYPQDYDLVTHEAMHIVQGYTRAGDCPYWVEGVADVARAWFGKNNVAAGWRLVPGNSVLDGTRQSAHFLDWVAYAYGRNVIVNLDQTLRASGCPGDDFWIAQTRLSGQMLWDQYVSTRGG